MSPDIPDSSHLWWHCYKKWGFCQTECLLLPFCQCPYLCCCSLLFQPFLPTCPVQFPVTTIVSLGNLTSVYLLIPAEKLDVERAGILLCLGFCLLIFLGFQGQWKERSAFTFPATIHVSPRPSYIHCLKITFLSGTFTSASSHQRSHKSSWASPREREKEHPQFPYSHPWVVIASFCLLILHLEVASLLSGAGSSLAFAHAMKTPIEI